MNKIKQIMLFAFTMLLLFSLSITAQLLTPRVSPQAEVMQQIGVSQIRINYSRPAVNGREVWGKLVPYGLAENQFGNGNPMPWRAGANENTSITFTDDVKVNGKSLKAGSYGIHLIPNKDEDWILIFSDDHKAWGSFFYNENHDALRISVKPEKAQFQEWLEYGFDNITPNSVRAYVHWENLLVPLTCEFDVVNLAVKNIEAQLTGALGFQWQVWMNAAAYCYTSNTNLSLGEKWIRKSITLNENVNNRNMLGYILMAQNNKEGALTVFKENMEKYSDNWNTYDSYGEALKNFGEKSKSIEYYKKALEMAPDNQKGRIEGILSELEGS